jgi:hypothetical protein
VDKRLPRYILSGPSVSSFNNELNKSPMKARNAILLTLMALQPILWWAIFNGLESYAKAHDSVIGLAAGCIISAILMIIILFDLTGKKL